RWRKPWRAADGLVELDVHELQALEAYRLQARPYSVSALEQYAACPYRFALRCIHELHPRESHTQIQRMDAAQRGQLFHRVQFELFRNGGSIGELDAILDRVAREFAEEWAPAIPHVWAAEIEALRVDMRGWLQQRAKDEGWDASWDEFSFGRKLDAEHHPASIPDAVTVLDGVRLKGSIDLIERHAGGIARVVDHKTGSVPEKRPVYIGKGETLQPVLYGLVAEAALGAPVTKGRLHYATLRQNY